MPHLVILLTRLLLPVLLPLDGSAASPEAGVHPQQSSGFADYIVGGFFGLAILVGFAVWTSRRPRRPS